MATAALILLTMTTATTCNKRGGEQKARIEVNEEGTKAAAVTVAEMDLATAPGPKHYEKANFHATRPFVYYIMEMSTRSVFFMGTYFGES